jgi:hypothetical protein
LGRRRRRPPTGRRPRAGASGAPPPPPGSTRRSQLALEGTKALGPRRPRRRGHGQPLSAGSRAARKERMRAPREQSVGRLRPETLGREVVRPALGLREPAGIINPRRSARQTHAIRVTGFHPPVAVTDAQRAAAALVVREHEEVVGMPIIGFPTVECVPVEPRDAHRGHAGQRLVGVDGRSRRPPGQPSRRGPWSPSSTPKIRPITSEDPLLSPRESGLNMSSDP